MGQLQAKFLSQSRTKPQTTILLPLFHRFFFSVHIISVSLTSMSLDYILDNPSVLKYKTC